VKQGKGGDQRYCPVKSAPRIVPVAVPAHFLYFEKHFKEETQKESCIEIQKRAAPFMQALQEKRYGIEQDQNENESFI